MIVLGLQQGAGGKQDALPMLLVFLQGLTSQSSIRRRAVPELYSSGYFCTGIH